VKRLAVRDWLAATHRPPCLDLREPAAFARGHLPGAGNVPLGELDARIHELPRRGTELFVVGGPEADRGARVLETRARWSLAWSPEPPEDWPAEVLDCSAPSPLWSPSPWLEEHWQWLPARGRVLDLAMGSGRNAVWLALRGFRVEGEDILPEAVRFAEALATRHGVALDARVGDVTRPGALVPGSLDGLLVFNFLNRELLPRLAEVLVPGGVLLYESFLVGQAGKPRRPQWLLEPLELKTTLEPSLEILAYREGEREPGRPLAGLVGRRPGR
jgi:tellurite methyltransferase